MLSGFVVDYFASSLNFIEGIFSKTNNLKIQSKVVIVKNIKLYLLKVIT